ncbi:2-keto-3-deoxygalactonate kinase [Roseivivax lentus]|uniref:2-keto-3-deoxygalactonate kinase n=1 Tax=Roseivivax lentus TaxID=633194 RepID=A0A1N7LRK8_9RHOB|nr:2-dehydro-3-deoxygalactonokinase [Roseivivax lentus]SIS76480.1 2-keto-3-deoxygalactonate kinase [Roseivivax lentus]
MSAASWIAVDWGLSNLRAWVIGADGDILDKRVSGQGVNTLARDAFEAALLDLIGDALPETGRMTILVCGNAGAREGWAEAPYRAVPSAPPGVAQATRALTLDPRLDIRILPGLKQMKPPDVMRGEETQIAGVFAARPNFDGVICLPGTHTKWAQVSAREVVSFRTFMTGEIFALLEKRSVLRHVVGDGWDDAAFAEAVGEGMSRPAPLASNLFSLRAEALLAGLAPDAARARLSGLLIGMELAGARAYWLGQPVLIVGEVGIAQAYRTALAAQGAMVETIDAEAVTLGGLVAARAGMKDAAP